MYLWAFGHDIPMNICEAGLFRNERSCSVMPRGFESLSYKEIARERYRSRAKPMIGVCRGTVSLIIFCFELMLRSRGHAFRMAGSFVQVHGVLP